MPKYNFMISRAVDMVAKKLAGLDKDTITRLSQILSEEAQLISEELNRSGQQVDSNVLAARLEGLVARMKYEMRNQKTDPSPHEFPIFNVSHNPAAPYPNPINHLYDKRYKEAYATYIKQNQPDYPAKSPKSAPPTPTSPSSGLSSKETKSPTKSQYLNYPYGQQPYQENLNNTKYQNAFAFPMMYQLPDGSWQYVYPNTATMPSSQSIPPVRRSSTSDDLHSRSVSRSASENALNYTMDTSNNGKIRVHVIDGGLSSTPTDTTTHKHMSNNAQAKKSILKSSNGNNGKKETVTTPVIVAAPNTEIDAETMEDLLKVVRRQQSDPTSSGSSPVKERIIIIDRRGSSTSNVNQGTSEKDRIRAFEVRTSTNEATTPSATAKTSTPTSMPAVSSNRPTLQQPNDYYSSQPFFYPPPKTYSSFPNNMYPMTTNYMSGANNYYPFIYFQY